MKRAMKKRKRRKWLARKRVVIMGAGNVLMLDGRGEGGRRGGE